MGVSYFVWYFVEDCETEPSPCRRVFLNNTIHLFLFTFLCLSMFDPCPFYVHLVILTPFSKFESIHPVSTKVDLTFDLAF